MPSLGGVEWMGDCLVVTLCAWEGINWEQNRVEEKSRNTEGLYRCRAAAMLEQITHS